jgi:hypothetical protein
MSLISADAKPHASAPAAPFSLNAAQQPMPAERSITFGAAATSHADRETQQHDQPSRMAK